MTKMPSTSNENRELRMETPASLGLTRGKTSSDAIATRLDRLFRIPGDAPSEFGAILQTLDQKMGGSPIR